MPYGERKRRKAGPESAILISPSGALGSYWGEMVSRVGSTGGRWSVEWAVLGGDGQQSGQYWGEMVSRVGSTGGRWSAEWAVLGRDGQ